MWKILLSAVIGIFGAVAAAVSWQIWEAASKNSASPGVIILIPIAAAGALVAVAGAIGVVVGLLKWARQ